VDQVKRETEEKQRGSHADGVPVAVQALLDTSADTRYKIRAVDVDVKSKV